MKPVSFQTIPDSILEGEEHVNLTIVTIDNGALISPTQNSAVIIITADTKAIGTISISPNSLMVVIGRPRLGYDGGTSVTLLRTAGNHGVVQVYWQILVSDLTIFSTNRGIAVFRDLQTTTSIDLFVSLAFSDFFQIIILVNSDFNCGNNCDMKSPSITIQLWPPCSHNNNRDVRPRGLASALRPEIVASTSASRVQASASRVQASASRVQALASDLLASLTISIPTFPIDVDSILGYWHHMHYIITIKIAGIVMPWWLVIATTTTNNNNNNLLFIHTLHNFTNSQRCEPCHLYELAQRSSLDTTSSTRC